MELTKKNKVIHVGQNEYGIFQLIEAKTFYDSSRLMEKNEANEVLKKQQFKEKPLPYTSVFSPSSLQNQKVIKAAKKGDIIILMKDGEEVGDIEVTKVYKVNENLQKSSIFSIYTHEKDANNGSYALAGKVRISKNSVIHLKNEIKNLREELNIKKVTALFYTADPFHRVHEHLLRVTMDKADLLIIFLIKSTAKDVLNYDLRKEVLEMVVKDYFPKRKVLIIPLSNTFIFSGHINSELECLIAHSFGATKLVIGQEHKTLGMYFEYNQAHTILDKYVHALNIEITIIPEYVYCNECTSIVSVKNCPHGQHHHIKYSSPTLKSLLKAGILPPSILMRKEVSAKFLTELFPKRFENIQQLYDRLFPNKGILEEHSEEDFYIELMKLYRTSSLI